MAPNNTWSLSTDKYWFFLSLNTPVICPVKRKPKEGILAPQLMFPFNCFWISSLWPEIVSSQCQSAPLNKMLPTSEDRVCISCLVVHTVCWLTSLLFIYYPCYFNTQAFINKSARLASLVSLQLLASEPSPFTPLYGCY